MIIAKFSSVFQQISLKDGRKLMIRESLTGSRFWLVFLSGSAAEWSDFDALETQDLMGRFREEPNLLIIGKPGVAPDGRVSEAAFERSFRRDLRVRDYLDVLRQQIPARDKILLMGFSEGAYLSPEIASLDPRVRAVALLSGGTRSWIDEEIYKMGARQEGKVLKRIGRVYARPESRTLTWFGNSHATWMSYDNERTAESLRALRIPILAIHGSNDRMIDVDSARQDLRDLSNPQVEMHLLNGEDHTLGERWNFALKLVSRFFAGVTKRAANSPRSQTLARSESARTPASL